MGGSNVSCGSTYMLPPRSLIWKVTTASAIQIMAKTPLKTNERWSSRALIERRKDRSRQKSSGPLEEMLASSFSTSSLDKHSSGSQNIPKIPIPQTLAHPTL